MLGSVVKQVIYNLIAILSFIFVSAAFLARFLRKEIKQALLSLFLEVLGGSSREVDSKAVDSKLVYSKDIGSRKASSKKVSGFLADFALSLLLLSTKSYKECLGIYFLKYISYRYNLVLESLLFRNRV